MDIRQICVEEIALEGLEGITLPALWLRMNHRKPKLPYTVSDKLHEYLWKFILDQTPLGVVQIPKPRDEPQIFERTVSIDEQRVPVATAPDELDTIVEVYGTSAVKTDDPGINGCCSNYNERVDIKDEIIEQSLDLTKSFAKYGRQRIVIVASQSLREHALLSGNLSRVLLEDLSEYCYCVLELIARSRWEGVIMSRLSKMNFPHKAFHAIVKKLQVLGLVTKSHHSYKVAADSRVCSQILVNLKKYERTSLPLCARVMKAILDELQNAPNHSMNLGVLKEKFHADTKPFKSSYQTLKKTGEITITSVRPGKQMRTVYEMVATLADKQDLDEEEDPEPAVDNDDLALTPLTLDRPYLNQAYDFIKLNAVRGVCQSDMKRFLKGFGTLDARYVLKSLLQKKVVDVVLFDKGKQRIRMYIPKAISANCSKSKEFIAEKKKMQELVLSTKVDDATQDGDKGDPKPAHKAGNVKSKGARKSKFEKLSSDSNLTAQAETTHLKKWDANLTARTIKRHNVVLEYVNREKVVIGFVTIRKLINTAGKKDGDTSTVDHHSVTRLVEKMKASGVLKHDEVPITYKDVTEIFHFVRSLDCPDAQYESAIEQARFKHIGREENRIARQDHKNVEKQEREVSKKKDETPEESQDNPYFQPRFKRLRVLHEFLWYLAYGHPQSTSINDDNSETDTPKVYDPELTWKRYLPPAPLHPRGTQNWLQVGELALIMPLSILCQFHRPCRITDELEEYLQDADKRHMLVRHLPPGIKCILLAKRKYIYSLTECVHQLFFMGLVTMTCTVVNSRCMPKESMMLYVHQNVTVVDTRTSRSGYMKVEEKHYEKIAYKLDDSQVLDSFWYKLQAICMQTKLGSYQHIDGEPPKSHMCNTTVKNFVKSSSETVQEPRDDGHIPGDGRGAGGLDSSLFSFLYRNWNALQARKMMKSSGARKKRQPAVAEKSRKRPPADVKAAGEPKPKLRKTASKESEKPPPPVKSRAKPSTTVQTKEIEVVMESNVGRNERVKGGRGVKRKAAPAPPEQPSSSSTLLNLNKVRRRNSKKAGGMLKQGKQRIKYLDDVDLEAIKRRNGRIRASFTKAEDALYLLCHVTTTLLVHLYWKKPHRPRKQIIPWSVVRDIMHSSLPESADKTSYSGGRRTHILMKNPETRICHDISVADIKSDDKFLAEFCPPELDLECNSAKVREVYCKLVEQLKKRFKSQPGLFEDEIPDTSEQVLNRYVPKTIICKSGDIVPRRCYFDDAINDELDVRKSVAENMIYIALAMSDSEFSIFQAYRAFEEFPESTLKDVFSKMKIGGYACRKRHQYRKVPYAMRMYRLTYAHHLSLKAPVPMTVVDEVSQGLEQSGDLEIKTVTTLNHVFLTSYFMTKKTLDIEVDIPDDVVVPEALNSSVFENQFRSMLQGAEKDLLKEVRDSKTNEGDSSTVPPDSLMAAAACILKENFDDNAKTGENSEANSNAADRKLKIAELMRLYHRHPSYSNWLILIKPNSKRSESKFSALNFSSTSDCIVLTPCTIKINNTLTMLDQYCNVDPSERVTTINNLLRSKPVNIERSEAEWAQRNRKVNAHGIVARAIFDSVDSAGYAGISMRGLFESVRFDNKSVNACLDVLFEKLVLYSVGIKEIRVVSYKNVSPWVAKGFRYKDGNRNFQNEILYELKLFQPEKSGEEVKEKKDSKEEAPAALPAEGKRLQSKYEAVEFICRPWHNLCGEISFASAKSLLTSVFMKVYSSPGITQDSICASLSYQRVVIVELLRVLKETGCIQEMSVECPGVKRLFGAPSPAKTVVYYEATDDGLVIVSQWTSVANKMISLSGAATEE